LTATDAASQVSNDYVKYSVERGYDASRKLTCTMARRLLGQAITTDGQYATVLEKLDDGLYKLKLDDGRTVVAKQEDLLETEPVVPVEETTAAPTPEPHGWGASILTAALGVLCVLGLVLCWLFSGKGEEKKKKKKKDKVRAIEVEAPVVQAAPPPAPTTSAVLAPAAPTYTAAPVTFAAPSPVATYSAPVTYASAPVPSSYVVAAPATQTATYATSQVVHAAPTQMVHAAPTQMVQAAPTQMVQAAPTQMVQAAAPTYVQAVQSPGFPMEPIVGR